jgi:amino acid transporter
VNALRYSLLLPLLHLAISAPVIYYEEAFYWRYIPRIQAIEDFEKTAPPLPLHSGPMIGWNPCYEYRPSTADKFIFLVEFPAGTLIPPHGASDCNPTVLRPILQKLKNRIRLETRVVILDSLLIFGIAVQWGLVGRWLERLRRRRAHLRLWIMPVVTITIAGSVVAASSLVNWRPWEIGAAILALIAFLAWVVLLLMFVVTAVRWSIRFGRKAGATEQN